MKNYRIIYFYRHFFLLLTLLSFVFHSNSQPINNANDVNCLDQAAPNNLSAPDFKIVKPLKGNLKIGKQINWDVNSELKDKYAATFLSLEKVTNSEGLADADALTVEVKLLKMAELEKLHERLPEEFKRSKNSYLLQVRDKQVNIYAENGAGIVNGLSSLEYLINEFKGSPYRGDVADWPDIELRGVELGIRDVTPALTKAAIDRMRRGHYNLLLLAIDNNVRFASNKRFTNSCAWSIEEFVDVIEYAKQSGLEIVPYLRLLTHQEKDLFVPGAYPELMYNARTYDPRKKEVYQIIYAYIDEIIEVMKPTAIHIGHDEVTGVNDIHTGKINPLPPHLFKDHVLKIHAYLKNKNIRTWMWGDMLITPSEFPEMHPGSINGTPEFAAIRKDIPRDILICDWHYRDESLSRGRSLQFPTMKMFIDEGFDVIGSTFRHPHVTKSFPKYALSLNEPKMKGMMTTTWHFFEGKKETTEFDDWKALDAVLEFPAEVFWNVKW